MKVHSLETISKIKDLRKIGYTINEIVTFLKVPKTTVWHHIRNVEISEVYRSIIHSKRGGSAVRSKKQWDDSETLAKQILLSDKSVLAVAATMLYWGEGGKKVCDIINTDPKLLQLYLKFLNDVLGIKSDKIKFAIRIFTGMSETECLSYWSNNLRIDANKFIIRYNDGGVSGKSKYGMCRLTVKKGGKALKIMHSLIRLSFSDLMELESPIPQWIDHRRTVLKPYGL